MNTVFSEIKKYGITFFNDLGDAMVIKPKNIKFYNNGKNFKALSYDFKTLKDLNKRYIITKETI